MKKKIISLGILIVLILISGCIFQAQQGAEISEKEKIDKGGEDIADSGEVENKTPVNLAEVLNKTDQEVCEMTLGKWVNGECVCPEGYSLNIYKNTCVPRAKIEVH